MPTSLTPAARATPTIRQPARILPVRTFLGELPWAVLAVLLLGGLVALWSGDTFILNTLATAFLFAGLASAWNIIGGFGGQFSLAHSVFFAVGAYTTANLYLKAGLSPWVALLPAAALAAAVACLLSWPLFRLRGPFFAIATMAFTEVALALGNYMESLTGGTRGMSIPFRLGFANMIFRDRMSYALLMLGFAAVCLLVVLAVNRSRLGYYLQAVRDNEQAARAAGISVLRVKLTGMAISAALTGIGGGLFFMQVRVADPAALLSLFDFGVKFALIALIGGLGTIYGPILGALVVIPLESWLRATLGGVLPGANLIVLSICLILASLFMKHGIIGALGAGLRRIRR
ncbi:MAG: branched-chain amino acid ABC transporter permease [Janthinobacterium lividum]